jgi:hypothetical protein
MAKAKGKRVGGKKERKNVLYGRAYIHATFNNTIITVSPGQVQVRLALRDRARAHPTLPRSPRSKQLRMLKITVCEKLTSL